MGITSEVSKTPRSKEIDTRVMTVTPAHAEKWLEMNTGNRRMRPSHVQHLSNEMKKGRWMLSPEPIVFSRQGRLLDGQHRLSAVLMSGCTIEASVALVQNEDVFRVLDQGINRSNSDILGIPTPIITPLQYLIKGSIPALRKVTSEDVRHLMKSRMFDLSTHLHEVIKPKDKRFKNAPFRAAYIMAVDLGLCDQPTADKIYTDLSHMNMTEWTRMMQSIFHQIETIKISAMGGSIRHPVLMRALYLFSEAHTKKTTIRLTDQYEQQMVKAVKARVLSEYNKGAK